MSVTTRFVPPQIAAAAQPLRRTADLLAELRSSHDLLLHLTDGSPSPAACAALRGFVDRWDDAAWRLAGTAGALASQLEHSAQMYARTEAHLVDGLSR